MNESINISSDSRLLAGSASPVLVVMSGIEPQEQCHELESLPHCTIENVHLRAETVTPTLQQILDYCPPEHWDNDL